MSFEQIKEQLSKHEKKIVIIVQECGISVFTFSSQSISSIVKSILKIKKRVPKFCVSKRNMENLISNVQRKILKSHEMHKITNSVSNIDHINIEIPPNRPLISDPSPSKQGAYKHSLSPKEAFININEAEKNNSLPTSSQDDPIQITPHEVSLHTYSNPLDLERQEEGTDTKSPYECKKKSFTIISNTKETNL